MQNILWRGSSERSMRPLTIPTGIRPPKKNMCSNACSKRKTYSKNWPFVFPEPPLNGNAKPFHTLRMHGGAIHNSEETKKADGYDQASEQNRGGSNEHPPEPA